MNLPTLYRISKGGKVLVWTIRTMRRSRQNGGFDGVIVIEHGHQDGRIQIDKEFVKKGKNLGKKNATTPVEQARLQSQARWNKQLDKGYRETIEEARKAAVEDTRPMLAHKLADKSHKLVVGKVYAEQPKLDGMRCIAVKNLKGEVRLISRIGRIIEAVPHIAEELTRIMPEGDIWDGELYVHGMPFEMNQSINKRKANNLHPDHESMEYHVFDAVSDDTFENRYTSAAIYIEGHGDGTKINTVPWLPVTYECEDQLVVMADRYAANGYEGLILRCLESPYEHVRTIQLIKVKRFHDDEFKIVDTCAGKSGTNDEDLLIKFVIEHPVIKKKKKTGEVGQCEVTLMGTRKQRKKMLTQRDKYIGKWCTVIYQELSTKCGAPRFAKVKAIREMENLQPVH